MYSKLFIVLALTVALATPNPAAAAGVTQQSPMQAHAADPRDPGGNSFSRLYRGADGIGIQIKTKSLDRAAYTVWLVVFNYPQYCASGPCTAADLPANGGDPRVEASILWGTGDFVPENGKARFGAGLAVGDTRRALFGPGLLEPMTAEIHPVIRTHGSLRPADAWAQVTTPSGGCPAGGCKDQQFAIHQ